MLRFTQRVCLRARSHVPSHRPPSRCLHTSYAISHSAASIPPQPTTPQPSNVQSASTPASTPVGATNTAQSARTNDAAAAPTPTAPSTSSSESASTINNPAAPTPTHSAAATPSNTLSSTQQQPSNTQTATTTTSPESPPAQTPIPPIESTAATSPAAAAAEVPIPPPVTPVTPIPTPVVEVPIPEVITTASASAPAAFNAAAAAAAATGLPPPAVTTATTIAETPVVQEKQPCPDEIPPAEAVLLSQSPPAGLPLPFPPNHLLWMANGTQVPVAELFLSHPVPEGTPPPPPRLVLVVGFVGAYLSLCQTQLPAFSHKWQEFKKRGVDAIYGVSVNDHAVLKSFAEDAGLEKLTLIADQDATFVRGLNLAMDLSAAGMGVRSKRFVMVVREGMVEEAWVESNPGALTVSSAESVLKRLPEIKKPAPITATAKVVAAVQAGMAAVSDAAVGAKDKSHATPPPPPAPAAPVAPASPATPAAAPAAAPSTPIAGATVAAGIAPEAFVAAPITPPAEAQPLPSTPAVTVVTPAELNVAAAPSTPATPTTASATAPPTTDSAVTTPATPTPAAPTKDAAKVAAEREAAASVLNDPPPGQA